MTLYLGAAHYYADPLSARPQVAVQAIRLLGLAGKGSRVSFYGMLAGSDTYARPKVFTGESLAELETDIRAGVFSDIIAYSGKRLDPTAMIGMQVAKPSGNDGSLLMTLVVRCTTGQDLLAAENLALDLWATIEGLYGLVTLGPSFAAVAAELNCTPIRRWDAPAGGDDERLLLLQRLRPQFGAVTRGAAWGSFLGDRLIERLGGGSKVRTDAPVHDVREVANGLYLRLTDRPAVIAGDVVRQALRLNEFLAPVTPPAVLEIARSHGAAP